MQDEQDSDNEGALLPAFDLDTVGPGDVSSVAGPDRYPLHAGPGVARRVLLQARLGERMTLDGAGTTLEHPYVYDDVARELQALAATGAVEVIETESRAHGDDVLICRLVFVRRR